MALASGWLVLGVLNFGALADITVLQQGVSPTAEYAGCKDTWISGDRWTQHSHHGNAPTLSCYKGGRILIRFDLSPIPSGDTIHKAVLRLADATLLRKGRDGKFPTGMRARRMTRAWEDSANWSEHTRVDPRKVDEGDWKTAGGEFDTETVYGTNHVVAAGAWGHKHDLDITALVRLWHAGTFPNYGMAIENGSDFAAADWPVPGYRPQLIIDHGKKDRGIAPLTTTPAEIEFDPIAGTEDSGTAKGDYAVVRVGQHPDCALRGASTSAYIKENAAQYPGTWGWMTECRVGGVAGDFSRTLLYFDLGGIPKDSSIKAARLVCSLAPGMSPTTRGYRYGAFLLKLPDAPGWNAEEVTAAERRAGSPWPGGGILAVSSDKPLAIGTITQKKVMQRDRKVAVDAGIEFDLTGAVRAWVVGKAPNCGIVLDNRIEGGAYDIHSSRSYFADLRPYLEITLSPAIKKQPEPLVVEPRTPTDDYWVEPMRKVHKLFKGKAGTLAQYGDSITITGAFLAGYGWSGKIDPRNITPEVQKEAEAVQHYADLKLWRTWKGSGWGNDGSMKSDWLFQRVDGWQQKMNPEVAVIMFGTNDRGKLRPPQYTENMAASIKRMLADGTVPILTSIPPPCHAEYWYAALSMARGLQVPLIDYYAETMRRRPDDYNGKDEKFKAYNGYDVPTIISRDGTHPSNPKQYVNDWSEEALSSSGYALRNYMTIRKYYQVIDKCLTAGPDKR